MRSKRNGDDGLPSELERLQARLDEVEATLEAIRSGEVDAIVVNGPQGNRVFTLETADQPYRVLAESMNEGAATVTLEGTILFCNRRFAEMLDCPAGKLVGASILPYLVHFDESRLGEMISQGQKANVRREVELFRNHDSALPVLLSLNKIPLSESADGICLVATDLSAQKRQVAELQTAHEKIAQLNQELEQRVEKRTADLKAAVQELEAFSYSVSHDLRAPVRAVEGFSRILFQDHLPEFSEDARHCLDMVRQSAIHMGELIDGLLAFSRLGRRSVSRRRVNTAALMRQAWQELAGEQQGRQVQLTVHELPCCYADPLLLRQVFANLLSNALKYSRPREVARIELGGVPYGDLRGTLSENNPMLPAPGLLQPDSTVFYVRDNGVGFSMDYSDNLFGVFQRLHASEEFEGTGVGLATVRRIIQKHGGFVWAESRPDRGATFYFTIGSVIGDGEDKGNEHAVMAVEEVRT